VWEYLHDKEANAAMKTKKSTKSIYPTFARVGPLFDVDVYPTTTRATAAPTWKWRARVDGQCRRKGLRP
jgi:hypothetical protein